MNHRQLLIPDTPVDDICRALECLEIGQSVAPALDAPGRTSLSYSDLGAQVRYVRRRLGSWGVAARGARGTKTATTRRSGYDAAASTL